MLPCIRAIFRKNLFLGGPGPAVLYYCSVSIFLFFIFVFLVGDGTSGMYKGLGQLGLVLVCQNLNQKTFVISQSDRSGRRGDPWIKFFIVEFILDSDRYGSPKLKF